MKYEEERELNGHEPGRIEVLKVDADEILQLLEKLSPEERIEVAQKFLEQLPSEERLGVGQKLFSPSSGLTVVLANNNVISSGITLCLNTTSEQLSEVLEKLPMAILVELLTAVSDRIRNRAHECSNDENNL